MKNILQTEKSQLYCQETFLTKIEADELYNSICSKPDLYPLEKQPKGFAYGKEIVFHRSIGFFSDTSIGYAYSKQMSKSKPLTHQLKQLIEHINNQFSASFNGVLINVYECGLDYISAHSDDEKELDKTKQVVAISLGESRIFRVRPKDNLTKTTTIYPVEINKKCKNPVYDIPTGHGQLLCMSGGFQSEFTHEVPIEKNKQNIRISLTFRTHSK